MNVVDSCGWLEYFSDGENANFFAEPLQKVSQLLVPTLCIFEVFKKVYQQRGESSALSAIALMQQGKVIELTLPIALSAAKLSADLKIPQADSIVLATAKAYQALLWTQDSDFHGIEGIRYKPKNSRLKK